MDILLIWTLRSLCLRLQPCVTGMLLRPLILSLGDSASNCHELLKVLVSFSLNLLKFLENGVRHRLRLINILLLYDHWLMVDLVLMMWKLWVVSWHPLSHNLLVIHLLLHFYCLGIIVKHLHLMLLYEVFTVWHNLLVALPTCRVLIELIPELLQFHFILVSHVMRLLNTFLSDSPNLPAQNLTQLIDADAVQRHWVRHISSLIQDIGSVDTIGRAWEVSSLWCVIRLQLFWSHCDCSIVDLTTSGDLVSVVALGELEFVWLGPLSDRDGRLLLVLQ